MKRINLAFMTIMLKMTGVILTKLVFGNLPNDAPEMATHYLKEAGNILDAIKVEAESLDIKNEVLN